MKTDKLTPATKEEFYAAAAEAKGPIEMWVWDEDEDASPGRVIAHVSDRSLPWVVLDGDNHDIYAYAAFIEPEPRRWTWEEFVRAYNPTAGLLEIKKKLEALPEQETEE